MKQKTIILVATAICIARVAFEFGKHEGVYQLFKASIEKERAFKS